MTGVRVLVIDNYDSFTFNLVQCMGAQGAEVEVFRNDRIDPAGVVERRPDAVVISPGPCTPAEAGASVAIVRELEGKVPILGVCLGHQAIAVAYGGRICRAPQVVHGKTCAVYHRGEDLLAPLPSPFTAGRYHSLVVDPEAMPPELEVTAWSDDGVVMALRHRHHPTYGVQFHPESVLTPEGPSLIRRFLRLAAKEAA